MGNYLDKTGLTYFWGKLKNYFQPKLVSGTNIKTINSESLLGSGNINIQGGGGSLPIPIYYGVCSTAGNVAAKEVTVDGNFSLSEDSIIIVRFVHKNTVVWNQSNTTLNVNATGAKALERGFHNMGAEVIYYNGKPTEEMSYPWRDNSVLVLFHRANNNKYEMVGGDTPAESQFGCYIEQIETLCYNIPHLYMDYMSSGDSELVIHAEANSAIWSITATYLTTTNGANIGTPIPFDWQYNLDSGEITVTINTPIVDDDTVQVCVFMNAQP